MNVSLGKELEEYIKSKVDTGDYATASEVIRDGLRLMKDRDLMRDARLEALRGEIQLGLDQALAGELLDGQEVTAALRRRIEEKRS